MTSNPDYVSDESSAKEAAIHNLLTYKVQTDIGPFVWEALRQAVMERLASARVPPSRSGQIPVVVDFRGRFFPNYHPTKLSKSVGFYVNLSNTDLMQYSNAIVCQGIYYHAHFAIRLKAEQINADVANFGEQMIKNVGLVGVAAMADYGEIPKLLKAALDAGVTASDFLEAIIKLIPGIIIAHNAGQWINGDLEVFDWAGKYSALAPNEDLEAFFEQLYAASLPQWPNMTASTLIHYRNFLKKESGPTYEDFPESIASLQYSPQSCGYGQCITLTDTYSLDYLNWARDSQIYNSHAQSCCSEDTEILMADGTSKIISEISPGELIQGPEKALQPLYISQTLRDGRDLYEFMGKGKGPRLTNTHPISKPNTGNEKDIHAKSLSISAEGLRQILPNHYQNGAAALREFDTTVQSKTLINSKIETNLSETIKEIKKTDVSQHGNILYDVILPYSEKGKTGYYAGRNGKYVLIETEMIQLADDPYAGVALFELIAGLANHEDNLFSKEEEDESCTELRLFQKLYGPHLLQHAFNTAILNASKNDEPNYSIEEAGTRIDSFISNNWESNSEILGSLSVLLGDATVYLYTPLCNILRTAWREMPLEQIKSSMSQELQETTGKQRTIITLLNLEIFNPTDLNEESKFDLILQNTNDAEQEEPALIHFTINSEIDQPCHFILDESIEIDNDSSDEKHQLRVQIFKPNENTPVAQGVLKRTSTSSYLFRDVILKDAEGNDVARMSYDIRCHNNLTSLQKEKENKENWTDEAKFAYSVSFGKSMVEPVALALVRKSELLDAGAKSFLEE